MVGKGRLQGKSARAGWQRRLARKVDKEVKSAVKAEHAGQKEDAQVSSQGQSGVMRNKRSTAMRKGVNGDKGRRRLKETTRNSATNPWHELATRTRIGDDGHPAQNEAVQHSHAEWAWGMPGVFGTEGTMATNCCPGS